MLRLYRLRASRRSSRGPRRDDVEPGPDAPGRWFSDSYRLNCRMQRTLIISDTHLGHPGRRACTADTLRPLLEGVQRLVINGDCGEIQITSHRAEAARQITRLHDHCEHAGVELVLLSGNHDAYISDLRHLLLADGRVLLTHGDVLHPAIAPWCTDADNIAADARAAISMLPADRRNDPLERLKVTQHIAHRSFVSTSRVGPHDLTWVTTFPRRACALLNFWMKAPGWAAAFAEQFTPEAQVVVFGHSHLTGCWRRGKRLVINTGSFAFPHRPWAVELDGDRLTVRRLRRGEDGYRTRARPVLSRQLKPVTSRDTKHAPLRRAS